MSYLFCALLYRNGRFDPRFVAEAMATMTPTFKGEQMVEIAVSPEVTAIVYEPGRVRLKSVGFASGCELFLADTFLEDLHEFAVRSGHPDPQLYAWVSSDMSLYDVAMKLERDAFEGRLLIEDEGERISVAKGELLAYEHRQIEIDIDRDEDDEGFDEAYEEAQSREEAPFHPGTFLHKELGITRQQMIDALDRKGRRVWPAKTGNGAGSGADEDDDGDDFIVPAPPLWDWMRDELEKKKKAPAKKAAPAKKTAPKKPTRK